MTDPKTNLCEYCEEREIEEGKITTKYRVQVQRQALAAAQAHAR